MFRVLQEDITKLRDVEVVVNAANGIGVMGAGVAGAMARSGGDVLRNAAKKAYTDNGKPFEPGEVYITDSGLMKRLGIGLVYHGVVMKFPGGPTSLDIVSKVCRNVIHLCMINGVKSIALPGLGTGIGRLDVRSVAKRMVSILEPYSDSTDITLTDLNDGFIHSVREFVKADSI
jgi:O-acetyl-ADP-ribose deacetylase (regulator of RNase III)